MRVRVQGLGFRVWVQGLGFRELLYTSAAQTMGGYVASGFRDWGLVLHSSRNSNDKNTGNNHEIMPGAIWG